MLQPQVFLQVWWWSLSAKTIDWRDERGMTTETVIITAVLATLALAATAIIVAKVTTKANNIDTGAR